MIITCPHCQTKYQVTYEAIGAVGRKVQCAHCQQAWQQTPLDKVEPTPQQKQAFDAMAEDGLDEAMAAEEQAVAAEAAKRAKQEKIAEELQHKATVASKKPPKTKTKVKPDAASKSEAAKQRKQEKDFSRRQNARVADLPLARLRRTLRIVAALLLTGLGATAYFARVDVVARFPAMAGVYAAVGLGVNVVGLDFTNVTTLRTLRDGKDVLAVSAQIVGVMPQPVHVPDVVVTLIDEHGDGIYEWSVSPDIADLMVGERATFDTQLTMPPGEAAQVRLSFAGGESEPLANETGDVADVATLLADETASAHETVGHDTPAASAHAEPAAASEHPTPEHH